MRLFFLSSLYTPMLVHFFAKKSSSLIPLFAILRRATI
jgi:hypothetical protein